MRATSIARLLFAVSLVPLTRAHAQHGGPMGPLQPLTPSAIQQDLALFRTQFLASEKGYSPDARAVAGRRLDRLEAASDTVHRAYLELELARIVALADNGHTAIPAVFRAARFNRVPIRLTPFGEDFFVLQTAADQADLLGAKLIGVDQQSVSALRDVARTFAGGTNGWRDRQVPVLLESPEQLHALGLVSALDAATYRFQLSDGRTVTRRLVADAPDANAPLVNTNQWMYPSLRATTSREWKTLLTADQAPWSLQERGTPFRWRDAPEINGVVIELRQNVSGGGADILAFLQQMNTMLTTRKPTNIVLDMRMNGGGNLNLTRNFAQSLPTLASGRVFVLTSPYTFSAAISTVGYLKQAAPDRVSIVGETVGDRLMFWAEGGPVMLPNASIMIGHTTERHDYAGGCKSYPDCHGPVVRFPISVSTFAPDIPAPWTIADYRAGRDPAMAAVGNALKR